MADETETETAAAPPAQFFGADGKPLSGAALTDAWHAGTAHVAAGSQVHMLDADGDLRLVPAERVAAARAKGYSPAPAQLVEQHELQREHGGIGSQIATAAESAADTASVGAYGYAAGKLSPEYAKALLKRREANPTSQLVGSAIGLAPAVLTGGAEVEGAVEGAELAGEAAGLGKGAAETLAGASEGARTAGAAAAEAPGVASQLASATASTISAPLRGVGVMGGVVERGVERGLESLGYEGKSLLGRTAAKTVAGGAGSAAEGAVFGVGSELSDKSLENKDLTAESLVGSIGRNALFGGGIGAGLGGAGELIAAGIKAVTPSAEKLESLAKEQAIRSITQGSSSADIAKIRDAGKLDMSAEELLSYVEKSGPYKGQRLWENAGNVQEMADGLRRVRREVGAEKAGITQEIDRAILTNPEVAAVAQPDVAGFFRQVQEQVIDKLRASDVSDIRKLADKVDDRLATLRADHAASLRPPVAEVTPVGVGEPGVASPASDIAPAASKPITFARLDKFKQDLDQVIRGPQQKGKIAVVKASAEQLNQVRGILNGFINDSAQKALAAMGEDPAAYATLNRQYGAFRDLEKVARKTANRASVNRSASPSDHALALGGALIGMLSGNMGALTTLATGAAFGLANKIARENGNRVLAGIAHTASKTQSLLDAVAHVLAVSKDTLTKPWELSKETFHDHTREKLSASDYVPLGLTALSHDFEHTQNRIRELADPAKQTAQIAHATGEIGTHYPEQASAMTIKLQGIMQHLTDTMPQGHGGNQLSPLAGKPRVAPREQQRFLARVNAALDPASVIKDIGDGKLDKDSVATLQAVYPVTFQALKTKVQANLTANKSQLPYTRVVHISRVFGFDGDRSLEPARIAATQATIAQLSSPAPPGTPPGQPGKAKRGNPGVYRAGKSFDLPSQATPGAR